MGSRKAKSSLERSRSAASTSDCLAPLEVDVGSWDADMMRRMIEED